MNQLLSEIKTQYKEAQITSPFHCLLVGKSGSGKTTALRTARKPVLIHCFDPRGCDGAELRSARESGDVLVEYFDKEKSTDPTEFSRWERRIEELSQSGAFKEVGTLAIDSMTLWLEAAGNVLRKKAGKPGTPLELQEYQLLGILLKNHVKALMSLPCDLIFCAHIDMERDEVTGRMETGVAVFKSLRNYMPVLFNDVFVMEPVNTSSGTKYQWRTRSDGYIYAKTSLASLDALEPADFTLAFKKANRIVLTH